MVVNRAAAAGSGGYLSKTSLCVNRLGHNSGMCPKFALSNVRQLPTSHEPEQHERDDVQCFVLVLYCERAAGETVQGCGVVSHSSV